VFVSPADLEKRLPVSADARLLREAYVRLRVRDELRPNDLERAELRGRTLRGDVDGAHAALAEGPHDLEVPVDDGAGLERWTRGGGGIAAATWWSGCPCGARRIPPRHGIRERGTLL
jgi:hypothetical protein